MKNPELDNERIAALLAGTMSEPERSATLKAVAASDDDFWTFAETAAVLRRIEEEEEASGVPPSGSGVELPSAETRPERAAGVPPSIARPGWPGSRRRWLALAALAVLAILAPLATRRVARPGDPLAAPAASLASARDGLPPRWLERRPWENTLGADGASADNARAARAGAVHADLVVAVRAGDDEAVAGLVGEMERILEATPLGGAAARAYRQVGNDPARRPERLREAGAAAAAVLRSEEWTSAGAWVETARVAAARHDEGFFRAPATRAALEKVGRLPDLPSDARTALQGVRAATGAGPRWAALVQHLDELSAALSG